MERGVAAGVAVRQIGIGIAVRDLDAIAAVGGCLDAPREALGPETRQPGGIVIGECQHPGARQHRGRFYSTVDRFIGGPGRLPGSARRHGRSTGGLQKITPIHDLYPNANPSGGRIEQDHGHAGNSGASAHVLTAPRRGFPSRAAAGPC